MKLKLPAVILAILKKRGGTLDAGLRATRTQLIKTCEEHKYPPHASVIAFEAAFGGLVIPEEGRKIKKSEPSWLFGTHACLTSGAHVTPRGGGKARKLVPVVYSPNDIIYYLDEQGRGYAQDTIEDPSAMFYADNGISLVCRIVINDALFSREETTLDLPGLQGEELSKRLSLTLIKQASGKDFRYFCDATGDVLVVEEIKAKRTRFTSATKKQFKLVKPPAVPGADNATPEMIPHLGKSYVRMCGEQRTSVPEFFEHLPDLRDLDIGINCLETLPDSLWRATQLTKLDLSFNPLKTLPDGIGNMKALTSLSLRGCPFETLPDALGGAKNLTLLLLSECKELNVDKALLVIGKLPKLKQISLPLSYTLTSLAPLAHLPLESLTLQGSYVKHPERLPAGLGKLKKLKTLSIEYADDIAQLPEAPEDVRALRLLFSKRFTDEDIRQSALKQPSKLYLQAYAGSLYV